MEKLTVTKRNELLRGMAFKALGLDTKAELLQIAGSKFALDIELDGEFYPVRLDIVVPKIDADDELQTAVDMHEEYVRLQAEKQAEKQAKAEAKAKKMARDKADREAKAEAKKAKTETK